MKNLLCAASLLIVFSCSSPQQKNTEIVEENKDSTEVEITHNKKQSIRNVEAQVSFPKIEKEQPLDTIIHRLENGDTLFTYIYKYHDTIPDKPIRRFVTKNQKDSVIIKSFDEDFEFYTGTPEGDLSIEALPSYTLKNNAIVVSMITRNTDGFSTDRDINFDDIFNHLFDNKIEIDQAWPLFKMEINSMQLTFLQSFKRNDIEIDSVRHLLQYYYKTDLFGTIYQEKLSVNSLLIYVIDDVTQLNFCEVTTLKFDLDELSNAHRVLFGQYILKLLLHFRNIECKA